MSDKILNKIIKWYEYYYEVKIDRSNPQFVELCQKEWFEMLCNNYNRYQNDVEQMEKNWAKICAVYAGVPARQKMKYSYKFKIHRIKESIRLMLHKQITSILNEIFGEKNG